MFQDEKFLKFKVEDISAENILSHPHGWNVEFKMIV